MLTEFGDRISYTMYIMDDMKLLRASENAFICADSDGVRAISVVMVFEG